MTSHHAREAPTGASLCRSLPMAEIGWRFVSGPDVIEGFQPARGLPSRRSLAVYGVVIVQPHSSIPNHRIVCRTGTVVAVLLRARSPPLYGGQGRRSPPSLP